MGNQRVTLDMCLCLIAEEKAKRVVIGGVAFIRHLAIEQERGWW